MNPFSLPVLGGALLVSAPALWNSVLGETPLAVGLSRYLVAVVLCWMGLSVVAGLVGPVDAEEPGETDPTANTAAADSAGTGTDAGTGTRADESASR